MALPARTLWSIVLVSAAIVVALYGLVFAGDGDWRPDDAALPEGFPAPAEPGRVLVKWYPAARGAFVGMEGTYAAGTNRAFWPLFRHIQSRDIPMTAPVVADYAGDPDGDEGAMDVSFLYPDARTGALGPASQRVEVRDTAPVTVVSVGMLGRYDMESMRAGLSVLERWLEDNAGTWERAGNPRRLMYEQPRMFRAEYSEIQVPIRPVPLADCEG